MKYKLEPKDKKILEEIKRDFPILVDISGEQAIIQTIISLRLRWYLNDR